MVLKRRFDDGDDDGYDVSNSEQRQRLRPTSLFGEVSGISLPEFIERLEPLVRRVVKEEVEHAIQRFCHSSTRGLSVNQVGPSDVRAWQLHFLNKLPSTLFTSSKVESEESEVIKIVLVDTDSKEIITSGPLASLKVEVVALDGDFVAGEREEWTKEEFDACVIREREGKRPLVTGDLVITLRNGVAELDNVCFTDNSSWIRCRKFRLGARVHGNSTERVREAKSEAFMVKDHRGESYKKHHPPSLADEVWRLERIARDGAFHKRLECAGISTVKDFLCLYYTDEHKLRNVLGGVISKKTWDTILQHGTACVVDDKMYQYVAAAEGVAIVLNSVYKVIGATFDGQNYQNVDKLNVFQRRLVEDVKHQAYKHLDEWSPFNGQSFVTPAMASSCMQVEVLTSSTAGQNKANFPVEDQDLLRKQLRSDHMTTSVPNSFEVDNDSQLDFSLANGCYTLQDICPSPNNFMMKDLRFGSCSEEYSAGPSVSLGSVSPRALVSELSSQVNMSKWQAEGFFLAPPTNQSVDIVPSNFSLQFLKNGKPKARWCKLRAVIKWGISVRRVVAAKRLARTLYLDF